MNNLNENLPLLEKMVEDMNNQIDIYYPGPYWLKKSKSSYKNIKKFGIKNFRGTTTTIGESFTDSILIDIRVSYTCSTNIFKKFASFILKHTPIINRSFDKQLNYTKKYLEEKNELIKLLLLKDSRVEYLLNKYNIPESTIGGCFEKVELRGKVMSTHYLNLLDQHDYLTEYIDFKNITTLFEIGGGFGVNCHLLIENYPNIKKIIYLDIPPNLYIGTQYLKLFYGNSVIDYSQNSTLNEIKFSKNNNLEIFCIAPWQIEIFNDDIDLFYNSHSFVEMPLEVVKNYAIKLKKNKTNLNSKIALVSYSCIDLETTLDPNILIKIFNEKSDWINFTKNSIIGLREPNIFYISDF